MMDAQADTPVYLHLKRKRGIRAWFRWWRYRRDVKKNPWKQVFIGTRDGVYIVDDLGRRDG